MRRPRSAVRRRSRSLPAMRLNQTISRCGLRMTTPLGNAAVERCSWRMSCTKRCLWKRLRRCSRTICEMISPHTPPTSGGSLKAAVPQPPFHPEQHDELPGEVDAKRAGETAPDAAEQRAHDEPGADRRQQSPGRKPPCLSCRLQRCLTAPSCGETVTRAAHGLNKRSRPNCSSALRSLRMSTSIVRSSTLDVAAPEPRESCSRL